MKLPWMSGRDRRRWHSARTLKDLGSLVAAWLTGDIASQPGYQPNCGPDEETAHLIPILVAVNRLGYVTDSSQPAYDGPGYDGQRWIQRAAVSGLVDDRQLRDRLVAAAEMAGLTVVQHDMTPRRHSEGIPVTKVGGHDYTWFGRHLRIDDLRTLWPKKFIDFRAYDRVIEAWQLTLVDPEWGREDVLWEALAEVVRQYRLEAVEKVARQVREALSPESLRRRYADPDRARGHVQEWCDAVLNDAIDEARLSGCADADIALVTGRS